MATQTTYEDPLDKPLPTWFLLIMPLYLMAVMAIFLFPAAGDWRWFEGWAFNVTFSLTNTVSYLIINRKNPRVIRNRMKTKKTGLTDDTRESAQSDRFIMPLLAVGLIGAFIVPGLSHRFGWSSIPLVVEMVALVLTNAGWALVNMAQLQNAYASKILDINEGQVLVDTGLYGVVRHPLYMGATLWAVTLPVALGSWWGLIPAAVAVLALAIRIHFEEQMLVEGLAGYEDYQQRVKYKLIPGIY